MGIYTNESIFGIRMYTFNDDNTNTIFKREYNTIMTNEQIKEAYSFYQGLIDKQYIYFQIYTECSTTHNKVETVFMRWLPISSNIFLEKFGI
jgi:hypothetical protein